MYKIKTLFNCQIIIPEYFKSVCKCFTVELLGRDGNLYLTVAMEPINPISMCPIQIYGHEGNSMFQHIISQLNPL